MIEYGVLYMPANTLLNVVQLNSYACMCIACIYTHSMYIHVRTMRICTAGPFTCRYTGWSARCRIVKCIVIYGIVDLKWKDIARVSLYIHIYGSICLCMCIYALYSVYVYICVYNVYMCVYACYTHSGAFSSYICIAEWFN